MKTKRFHGSDKKLEKIENYHKHFGWVTLEKDENLLAMGYDYDRPNGRTLRSLEKQAKHVRSKFPVRMLIWLALFIVFLVLNKNFVDGVLFGSLNLNNIFAAIPFYGKTIVNFLPIVFISFEIISLFFAAYELLVWIFLKIAKRKILGEIFRIGDYLSGTVIDAPLEGNIQPYGENAGVLAKLDIGLNRIRKK